MSAHSSTLFCWLMIPWCGIAATAAEPASPASEGSSAVVAAALPPARPSAVPSAYTPEMLLADLTQQLTERYRVNGELQVDLLRAWCPPATSEPLALTILEAPPVLGSTLLVHFRLQAGNRAVAETSLLVRVQLMREVWCARAPAERGANFDPAQLDTRRVDTLRERDTIAAGETTGDLTLARTVSPGRVLTWHDVIRRPLIRKGQVIEVCAVAGALTVNMKALAMESGAAGETVRVRNIESKKEFSALVVAEARAEIRL